MLTTTFFFIAVVIIGTMISFILQCSLIDEKNFYGEVYHPPETIDPSLDTVIIGDKPDHLMWFMQISDIHLSVVFDQKRIPDFRRFCNIVVDSVRPSVVLATGDLTDSRSLAPFGSDQFEQEWKWYADALNTSRVTEKTVWLDMRGNHDTFNVLSWNSSNNFYRKYTHRGNQSAGHYVYTVTQGSDKYNFLGIDACPQPAPKRPFNFVGYLRSSDINSIEELISKAPKSNMTIFFGHYPTSSIIEDIPQLRNIITGPYLCGHFHTLVGLIPKMYATQASGYLEIEVADWKDERMFRVASVDHGIFNFVDVKLEQWPIILVTNPKAALAQMPRYEPLHRIANSTHIRVLAFSPSPIDSVSVRVDNEPWNIMNRASKTHPLFTYPWHPKKYSAGLHKIEVLASDENGNENTETVEFSIDGTKPEYPFGARFLLRVSTRTFLQSVNLFLILMSLFPIFAMRIVFLMQKGPLVQSKARSNLIYRIYFKFMLIGANDNFFVVMTFLPLYSMVGPWFIGDLLDGHWGICFAWAMYIDGHWVPLALPYLFASINMILFHIPLLSCLAHILHKRFLEVTSTSKSIDSSWPYLKPRHIILFLLLVCNVLFNFSICWAYGFKSLLFGFERFWSIFVYLYIWWTTLSFTIEDFRKPEEDRGFTKSV
ncbi:transmembrane protein 62 [Tetranychus urticae]|uniref:Uncharacterized protein n=1 Tax=Tetranychus urticae TaxID=32264 RepID=T1K696_TETUR|nr:transmembrane protein 62 [Tetranychus urticae]